MNSYQTVTDPTAVVGRRFGAYVIDSLVLLAIPVALFFATAGIELWERPTTCAQLEAAGEVSDSEVCTDDVDATISDDEYTAATYKPIAWAFAGGFYLLYLVIVQWLVQAMTGATLGKAIFGIRTVDEAGDAPGIGKQFVRGVLWIVDGLCNGLVALIAILASKGHRRIGDMAAKTYVVRSTFKGAPIILPGVTATPTPAYTAAATGAATGAAPTTGYQAPPAPGASAATDQTTVAPTPQADATQTNQGDGPIWDPERNAYRQWDPSSNRWLTYDDAASEWKPLEGDQPPPPPS
jgi:uncharacterized RDD family membrane protein YckC